jgi:hypothetical protein
MKDFTKSALDDAKAKGEKVILLGHHPVGGADFIVEQSRWYQSLVRNYSDVIVLQPTGHTHVDEFRMIYDPKTGEPKSVVFVAPAFSAGGKKNPSMRVYYLDRNSFELIDYDHYYLDLTPNTPRKSEEFNVATDWIRLLYSAKSAYGLADMSPQSWHDLTERFKTDTALLRKHLQHSDALAAENYICLASCRREHICRMQNADYDTYNDCVNVPIDVPTTPPKTTRSTTSRSINSASRLLTAGCSDNYLLFLHTTAALLTFYVSALIA